MPFSHTQTPLPPLLFPFEPPENQRRRCQIIISLPQVKFLPQTEQKEINEMTRV